VFERKGGVSFPGGNRRIITQGKNLKGKETP